ncbi:MAG: methyltransferase domain-containing protein [Clostridia bacterium]|nr:methyltransferase domain-containing protein [Clostridia bacterium]NCC42771.1 methyltransferase domain-containing protein [Clostridia bacterium]
MAELLGKIEEYWSTRTEGYSEVNHKELEGIQKRAWLKVLEEYFPKGEKGKIQILDIGTGPGFFPMILSEAGYHVTAVDYTEGMLEKAKENLREAGENLMEQVEFRRMDAQNLEFEDESFDVVISRNLTWNLEEPEKAYSEWSRVLKKGGCILNFDANWYGYLYDDEKKAAYEQDRENVRKQELDDHYIGTDIDAMEEIARRVPLSKENRPGWDVKAFEKMEDMNVQTDENIWEYVWSEEEKLNYGSTPMFMVCARKKREDFVLGGMRVSSGERRQGYLELAGGKFKLPAAILHGNEPGPTVLITAGVHAAEYVGIQAAIELSYKLKIEKVAGTVVIVKVMNLPAFEHRHGSMGLTDDKNLNREFPGDPKGTEMEQLAWAVSQELQPIADYYLDLHSGDDYEQLTPYVYYAGKASDEVADKSRKMAQQVDVPYMVKSNVASGGAYNYAASQGIPSILIERGGMGRWSREEAQSTRRDVRNILCHLGAYKGQKDYRKYYPLDVADICYQDASHNGCWYPFKSAGDVFQKDEILGEVRDYEGEVKEICRAEYDGVILYQTASLQVIENGPMIAYGRIIQRYDDRKERITNYWGKRSESFKDQRRAELNSPLAARWMTEIKKMIPQDKKLRILDVGCGTGFFTILLAKEGHEVIGTDLTPEMIEHSRELAKEEGADCSFLVMDAENLEFEDESFDLIISRNLTWTLPHVEQAYKDWHRVLKKDGILLNFDANYGASNFADTSNLPQNHAHYLLGDDMMRECEEIKRQLPISSLIRPAWDLDTLGQLGYDEFSIDLGINRRIYREKDEFYNPTPIFMICAKRR